MDRVIEKPIQVLLVAREPEESVRIAGMLGSGSEPAFEVSCPERFAAALDHLARRGTEGTDVILLDPGCSEKPLSEMLAAIRIRAAGVPVVLLDPVSNTERGELAGRDGIVDSVSPDERTPGALGRILRYASDRHRLERRLLRAQKLGSIGQLAAGIAHEINSPTQYVSDNVRFLQDAFKDLEKLFEKYTCLLDAGRADKSAGEILAEVQGAAREIDLDYLAGEVPKAIQQTLEGLEWVTRIVRAMKEFSHPGDEKKSVIDLHRALEIVILISRNAWKYVAELETEFDPAVQGLRCYPGELKQAILNLIVNAADAIADSPAVKSGGKGKITLSTRLEGDWVEIRVLDNGTGIPEEARPRIFQPFFTTKAAGKGTGQGLAIARALIEDRHGGAIRFESALGEGATFIIRLPAGDGATAGEE